MNQITNSTGAITMYTIDQRGYVIVSRQPDAYQQNAGLFVQPTLARINVNVLPMLPALGVASQQAVAEMTDDDYEAITNFSHASLQAQYREFGTIENGERVYPTA